MVSPSTSGPNLTRADQSFGEEGKKRISRGNRWVDLDRSVYLCVSAHRSPYFLWYTCLLLLMTLIPSFIYHAFIYLFPMYLVLLVSSISFSSRLPFFLIQLFYIFCASPLHLTSLIFPSIHQSSSWGVDSYSSGEGEGMWREGVGAKTIYQL